MKIDAYRDKLIRIGYFLGIGLLFYFFFAYALPLLLPFLLAWLPVWNVWYTKQIVRTACEEAEDWETGVLV